MATEMKVCYGGGHENNDSDRSDGPDILRVLNSATGDSATKGA